MELELIKAIYAAGFRAGFASGEDHGICYEHGCTSSHPRNAKLSWDEEMDFRLSPDAAQSFDANNPDHWSRVP